MTRVEQLDRDGFWLIIALGLIQGLAIYALVEFGKAPWLTNIWLHGALWGFAILLPPTAQWLIGARRRPSYWLLLVFLAALIAALTGYTALIETAPTIDKTAKILIGGGVLAWAATISLAATWLQGDGGVRDYPALFRLTCRTVFLPLGAFVFTGIFALLLWLCGALFDLIKIDFFKRLFAYDWFMWPTYGLVFGIATAILIERPALVEGVRRAGTAIASALLPVVVVIHLLFLVGLLVVGLEPLWATRHATPLVLTLLFVFLILLNGAHEDGSRLDCLARPIAAATRLAILLSPIYVAIAAYSLGLRVAQYGWSADRVITACIIAFLGAAILTYVIAGLRRPLLTLPHLGRANLAAMAALFILCVAINSPLLSPMRIAAANQEARILSGKIAPDRIDWVNLAFDLGRYGKDVVARLASVTEVAGAETIRNGAAQALGAKNRYALSREKRRAADNYRVIPGDTPAPDDLLEALRERLLWTVPPRCEIDCKLFAVDLNQDGQTELVLLAGSMPVYGRRDGRWERIGEMVESGKPNDRPAMIEKIKKGLGRTVPSNWLDLDVDGERLQFKSTR